MTRVVVTGASGRMGQVVAELVSKTPDFALTGASEKPDSVLVGQQLKSLVPSADERVKISGTLAEALDAGADVVIDFTNAEASVLHAQACAQRGVALVVGSTGLNQAQLAQFEAAGKRTALVVAPNLSVGVNVTMAIAAQLAKQLGEAFDVEVVETHHRHKRDAPSGTALQLANLLASALGRTSEDIRLARVGEVGARAPSEIGVQALRGGDVVGEHTVFYFGDGERVELTHRATSRVHFASGALRAAQWVRTRAPGVYSMADVLGLSSGA
jgi:4-hydroxy-tetrahydrodipicolinate reductase